MACCVCAARAASRTALEGRGHHRYHRLLILFGRGSFLRALWSARPEDDWKVAETEPGSMTKFRRFCSGWKRARRVFWRVGRQRCRTVAAECTAFGPGHTAFREVQDVPAVARERLAIRISQQSG